MYQEYGRVGIRSVEENEMKTIPQQVADFLARGIKSPVERIEEEMTKRKTNPFMAENSFEHGYLNGLANALAIIEDKSPVFINIHAGSSEKSSLQSLGRQQVGSDALRNIQNPSAYGQLANGLQNQYQDQFTRDQQQMLSQPLRDQQHGIQQKSDFTSSFTSIGLEANDTTGVVIPK